MRSLLWRARQRVYDRPIRRRMAEREAKRWRELYVPFVSASDRVFDIGANEGQRTAIFRDLGARVVACEPDPTPRNVLERRFGADPAVTIISSAVGDQVGEVPLLLSTGPQTSSTSPEWVQGVRHRLPGHEWNDTLHVPMTTLDELIATYDRPRFVKIDVEGAEPRVIAGLTQPIEFLSFEFTPELISNARDSLAALTALGNYEFNITVADSSQLLLREWVADDRDITRLLWFMSQCSCSGDVFCRRL